MTRSEVITNIYALFNAPHNADINIVGLNKVLDDLVFAEREACLALHDHDDVLAPIGASAWGEAYQAGWGEGTAAYYEAIKARNQT